jgi:aldose 1-epimerase
VKEIAPGVVNRIQEPISPLPVRRFAKPLRYQSGVLRVRRTCIFAALLLLTQVAFAEPTVTRTSWGKDANGTSVDLFTITAPNMEVKLATYGARLVSIRVPDRTGQMTNVLAGPDSLAGFLENRTSVMGATIGRYANRIAGGEFTLNGAKYAIPKNNNGNALHGGTIGFDRKVWDAKIIPSGVEVSLVSPDGDMGFPGNLIVHVRFTSSERHGNSALVLSYSAETDKPTVLNLTNHAYFNLSNDLTTSVFGDAALINADKYTPVNQTGIPTGAVEPVQGTPYDFRTLHPIGENAPERGYDNNFVLRSTSIDDLAAEVHDPSSGRALQVFTTEPGLQFYVPRFPPPPPAADGSRRLPLAAFCLETQHFPDSPNHPVFPSTVLLPGKPFQSTTVYVFAVNLASNRGK